MNAILQAQFQRVESALNTLIDSISAYTPSPDAALALIEADDELSKGLEQLSAHQSNHATLTRLHQTTASLSEQTTEVLTQLAKTRAELLETPATLFPEDARDVPYDELLTYAKRISKFTVPPTFRAPHPSTTTSTQDEQTQSPEKQPTSPAEQGERAKDATKAADGAVNGATTNQENGKAKKGVAIASLPPQESQWLEQAATFPFSPWPTEETIRRGALAQIQAMLEAGQDPAAVVENVPAEPDPAGAGDAKTNILSEQAQKEEPPSAQQPPPTSHEDKVKKEPAAETAVAAAKDISMNDASAAKENESKDREPKEKAEEKPAVFGGLDLYDPDDE